MLFAPLRPRVPRGLRALTAPARSERADYVMLGQVADHAMVLAVVSSLLGLTRAFAL